MTQRRGEKGSPRDLVEGGAWPDAPARADLPAPVRRAVAFAAEVSRRLDAGLEGRSVASVARDADVARSTVYDVRSGATWPDVVTAFKVEDALGIQLWGRPEPAVSTQLRALRRRSFEERLFDQRVRSLQRSLIGSSASSGLATSQRANALHCAARYVAAREAIDLAS